MAGAAGGFITRSFESMLKESKKYGALQKAIQAYLDCTKEENNQSLSASAGQSNVTSFPSSEKVSDGFKIVEEGKDLHTRTPVSTPEDEEVVNVESIGTSKSIMTALASAGSTLEGAQSEIVLHPLRLAFETKNTKLVELALDCLHKLIAYDHLEGDPGLEDGKNTPLLTDILNIVCNCVDNSSSDSTVLQVLKVLLTVVASAKFRVHGEPLLAVIRVCYSISIKSKNPINQATSKATLTQMISIIFRRMESDQAGSLPSSPDNPLHVDATSTNNGERPLDDQNHDMTNQGDPLLMKGEKDKSHTYAEVLQNLTVDADIKKLEAILDKAVNLEDRNKVQSDIDLENVSVGERDALLLFHTLCKMGMKEEKDEVTTRTRNLSLELLQGLLEDISDYFTKNFHFINSVKAFLSYALLRACVSSSSVVFQYAAGIFAVLLLRFRENLKEEIGIFFLLIVLRSLDSSDSSLSQRTSVLRMLEKVSKDSQMLVDIFVNYDCDLEAPNLFEKMVGALSRISQLMPTIDPNSVVASQISSIKTSSLQCLVTVMTSLVNWEKFRREYVESNISSLLVEEELSATELVIDESKNREEVAKHFEKAKDHKSTIGAAISEFNRKPSKGIELLISNKLVESTATSVAQFLKSTPTLDKAAIGEYFGQHEEFPLAVMHAYVDSMKFAGLKLDSAIREFLRGFWLPGEAQKIDRIMEKFAERYCADNPGLHKNADAAYTLAYAVLMLNADAHNPNVWPKMTKSDFVCMNSMNDGELCAPKELLDEIYDSVVKEEIKMTNAVTDISKSDGQRSDTEERGSFVSILNLSLPRRKTIPDGSKNEHIVKQTQALFRKKGVKRGTFYSSQQAEIVRSMIEAVGWPLLAAFSVVIEEGDDKARVLLCMEGFRYGIHITYILGMDTMRYAFLTSLIRLTFLHSPKKLRSKNVEALRTLLALCNTESDSLQDTWNAVLECVSRLDFIISTPFIASSVMQGSNQISRDLVLQSLRELGGKPVEQVFVHSVKLPGDSVVEFFTALCGISAEELKQTPARVYSLQKLVEISYYNMARIHLVWARIWSVLSHHFISAGSHYEERISMYAIDSLRQLGMKYLERAELKNFNFQNNILKPFVIIMRNSRSESIRGLIVDCIVQMIKSKVGSIKSGWKSVFMIFTLASNDNLEPIIDSAFENVEQVILEHFDQLIADCFMDCVNCLIGFANNKTSSQISLKAIALLRICENRLAEGLLPGGALRSTDGLDLNVDAIEHYWFPMLAGLSELTLDQRVEIRNCALEVLFDLLNERGWRFSSAFWDSIFHRVLFPIFNHVRHSEKDIFVSPRDEWLRDTIIHSLQLLCNLFNTFYKEVCFMLPPLLSLLLDCAKKTDQSVVSISLGALVHLVEVGGHQFSTNDWDTLLKSIRDASYTTQPLELLKSFGFDNVKGQMERNAEEHADRSDGSSIKKSHFGSEDIETTFEHANISLMQHDHKSATRSNTNFGESEGRSQETAEPSDVQTSQTFGQRIIGNIFPRSLTSKSKIQPEDVPSPSSPLKIPDSVELSLTPEEEENPSLEAIRGKCITQLLLLDVLNNIQRRYWGRLNPPQKISTMEIILSVLEFASSFNSYRNLRMRMHHIPSGRPPVNLLRQEIKGTSIYLDILQKTTKGDDIQKPKHDKNDGSAGINLSAGTCCNEMSEEEQKLKLFAEEKLVSFCEQMLKDASELHSSIGDATNVDIHRVLELRYPIIVKVLKGMCSMDSKIFQNHLTEFYPLITKLVCCDQMDVRGALADLFSEQLTHLLA